MVQGAALQAAATAEPFGAGRACTQRARAKGEPLLAHRDARQTVEGGTSGTRQTHPATAQDVLPDCAGRDALYNNETETDHKYILYVVTIFTVP